MDYDELEAILSGKTLFNFRAEKAFNNMDENKNGLVDKIEIIKFMKDSTEDDITES